MLSVYPFTIGGFSDGSMVVPEMEDLYEDMCDGACICALVGFYRPNEMVLRGLFFSVFTELCILPCVFERKSN